MSSDAEQRGLLAEYLEAAAEEREAWRALVACNQAVEDCSEAFLRWKRARQASQDIEVRWQAAVRRSG